MACHWDETAEPGHDVQVMLDDATGKCKGVGFVNYMSFEGARAAITAMHGSIVGDKVLHVSLQQQRDSSRNNRTY